MKIKLILTILTFSTVTAFHSLAYGQSTGQKIKIDSLKTILKTAKDDTNKVTILNKLACLFYSSPDDTSSYYANQAIAIANNLKFKSGLSQSYYILATANQYKSKYNEAIKYFLLSLKIDEQRDNKQGIASTLNSIAIIYRLIGNDTKALGYYEQSLKIREVMNDKRGLAASLNNIAGIYYSKGDKVKTKEYLKRALKTFEELGDKQSTASVLNNIGNLYYEEHDFSKTLEYFIKALAVLEEFNDTYGKAMECNSIGEVYFDLGDNKKAIEWQEKCINLAKLSQSNEMLVSGMESLSRVYAKLGNYKLAYEYHRQYSIRKDSIINTESTKQIAEMNTKYETEKKDKELIKKDAEINKQNAERKQRATERNTFIIAFALTIGLAFFIFRGYRQKQKANRLLAEKNTVIEEKNKDILDSIRYAKRIQNSLLPTEKYIDKSLKRTNKN